MNKKHVTTDTNISSAYVYAIEHSKKDCNKQVKIQLLIFTSIALWTSMILLLSPNSTPAKSKNQQYRNLTANLINKNFQGSENSTDDVSISYGQSGEIIVNIKSNYRD